jgi:hypothetical protein
VGVGESAARERDRIGSAGFEQHSWARRIFQSAVRDDGQW